MKANTLSLNNYVKQKVNKADSEKIALALCYATKRAWEDYRFTIGESGYFSNSYVPELTLKGYTLNFMLHTELDHSNMKNSEDYGTADNIMQHGKFQGIDIDEIQSYLDLHFADWQVICKYYFKHLHEVLDLSRVEVFNTYYPVKKGKEILLINDDLPPKIKGIKVKVISLSRLDPPKAVEGSLPTIGVTISFSTYTQIDELLKEYDKVVKKSE